ncbi:TPA_asm: hypothetical protein [Porphyromonas phage phage030a_KCOM2803]|uniref:Uncharacterized protein n=2 Tax=Nixviridae TaxID=3424665 RepID=A0AAT9JPH4_9CAUD
MSTTSLQSHLANGYSLLAILLESESSVDELHRNSEQFANSDFLRVVYQYSNHLFFSFIHGFMQKPLRKYIANSE